MPKRIDIVGQIVDSGSGWFYDWLGMENTTVAKVKKSLDEAAGEDVDVYINSPGGIVSEGAQIYSLLRDYAGNVHIKITGHACSAASVIASAADSEISPVGVFMIHNVRACGDGDYQDMHDMGDALKALNQSIINAYMEKTGMSADQLQEMMDHETYLSAKEAVEKGFVDRVMFSAPNQVYMNAEKSMIPQEKLAELKQMICKSEAKANEDQINVAKTKLKLLGMKGI